MVCKVVRLMEWWSVGGPSYLADLATVWSVMWLRLTGQNGAEAGPYQHHPTPPITSVIWRSPTTTCSLQHMLPLISTEIIQFILQYSQPPCCSRWRFLFEFNKSTYTDIDWLMKNSHLKYSNNGYILNYTINISSIESINMKIKLRIVIEIADKNNC